MNSFHFLVLTLSLWGKSFNIARRIGRTRDHLKLYRGISHHPWELAELKSFKESGKLINLNGFSRGNLVEKDAEKYAKKHHTREATLVKITWNDPNDHFV